MSIKIISQPILILFLCSTIIFPSQIAALFDNLFNNKPKLPYNNNINKNNNGLMVGFYDDKCPQAERIVNTAVSKAYIQNSSIAAGLIRLHFHDCFVNGCDASILLDSTPTGEPTEKISKANFGLRGFEVIDAAKSTLETYCPGTVSCADILAFAARDATTLAGLNSYQVPAGRRDGLVSLNRTVSSNLPLPESDVAQMEAIFKTKNLTLDDLVALLGAHSIGVIHCFFVDKNLYNFSGTHMANPKMDELYVNQMKTVCPPPESPTSNTTVIPMSKNIMRDRLSNVYYRNLASGRVGLTADLALMEDPRTREMVQELSWRSFEWEETFREAMVKMGNIKVLIGQNGQIRRSCRVVN